MAYKGLGIDFRTSLESTGFMDQIELKLKKSENLITLL